jgi:hypothetical protein
MLSEALIQRLQTVEYDSAAPSGFADHPGVDWLAKHCCVRRDLFGRSPSLLPFERSMRGSRHVLLDRLGGTRLLS